MSRALPRGTRGREVRDPTRQPGLQPACLDDLDWGLDVGRRPPGPQDERGSLDDGLPQAGLRDEGFKEVSVKEDYNKETREMARSTAGNLTKLFCGAHPPPTSLMQGK